MARLESCTRFGHRDLPHPAANLCAVVPLSMDVCATRPELSGARGTPSSVPDCRAERVWAERLTFTVVAHSQLGTASERGAA